MLPLSDRVLLKVGACPRTARDLSRELGADVASVHHVLHALEAGGAVEPDETPGDWGGARWRLAPGVRVEYRPGSVVLSGATPLAARRPENACTAVSSRGRWCRLVAVAEGLCFLHAGGSQSEALAGNRGVEG